MKKDMKELFRLLINRKRESIKLMFFLLLSILYLPMYNLYRHLLYSMFFASLFCIKLQKVFVGCCTYIL